MGYLSAGIAVLILGKVDARAEDNMQYEETKANCTMVRVAGLSKLMRIDLEEVFVRTDEVYQRIHKNYRAIGVSVYTQQYLRAHSVVCFGEAHTMSLGDTGAFNASVISWTFWLTLPPRVLIVRMASLKLF